MEQVRFVAKHSPYNAGDVATFEDDFAQALVTGGVAESTKPEPEPEPEPKSKTMEDKTTTKPAKSKKK